MIFSSLKWLEKSQNVSGKEAVGKPCKIFLMNIIQDKYRIIFTYPTIRIHSVRTRLDLRRNKEAGSRPKPNVYGGISAFYSKPVEVRENKSKTSLELFIMRAVPSTSIVIERGSVI